jgi:hypothetical protein
MLDESDLCSRTQSTTHRCCAYSALLASAAIKHTSLDHGNYQTRMDGMRWMDGMSCVIENLVQLLINEHLSAGSRKVYMPAAHVGNICSHSLAAVLCRIIVVDIYTSKQTKLLWCLLLASEWACGNTAQCHVPSTSACIKCTAICLLQYTAHSSAVDTTSGLHYFIVHAHIRMYTSICQLPTPV